MKAYFLLELVYVVGTVKCSGSLCCIYVYDVNLSGFEVGFDFHWAFKYKERWNC